ncbi:glucosaminidase domain-containing protein [Parasalinivibrio latis]|uniref:glucosaminidase domain-containing protein n=1 Tax=Parasalinivibrio latis TaxID=2952610 RepID=UPI0030E3EEAB
MSLTRLLKSAGVCLALVSSVVVAKPSLELPLPPEQLSHPYPSVTVHTLKSAVELVHVFERQGYQLETVRGKGLLPAVFVENLPDDLNNLPVEEKTSSFVRLLLPTITAVNDQILRVRESLVELSRNPKAEWSIQEKAWVESLMTAYGVTSGSIRDLLLHLDVIPTGMALAQGIDESGWGTSYFAINGNGLYGEHLPAQGGKFLTTPGGEVKVAAFDNLFEGTAGYIYNLNTTDAYRNLWELRRELRERGNLTGYELVQALSLYSTRGEAYVDNLRALIRNHRLDSFDHVKLDNDDAKRYRFEH